LLGRDREKGGRGDREDKDARARFVLKRKGPELGRV